MQRLMETASDWEDSVSRAYSQSLRTPTTSMSFDKMRRHLERDLGSLDDRSKHYFQKLAYSTEKVFNDRALLFDENKLLFEQNNEKSVRESAGRTVVGRAKIMSYGDTIEAQRRRKEEEAKKQTQEKPDQTFVALTVRMVRVIDEEILQSKHEIDYMGLTQYYQVLDFSRQS